ncbi:hypothetical protein AB6A40_006511 [Gnathostoma spinigerum]|uniref:Phosphoinositide phospholipase C n=1 Tax=Gnathostoma spinigerum TaxID=75299 RepID=A0ABD6ESZ4_9BILA
MMEQTSVGEEPQSLTACTEGIIVKRIKRGLIGPPLTIFIKDGKYLFYHSSAFWDFCPTRWKSVEIDELLEIRKGFNTDSLLKEAKEPSFRQKVTENCCFSVIFSHRQFLHKSLDFIASSESERDLITNAIQYLIDRRKAERVHFDERRWVIENFQQADTNQNNKLSFPELWKLLNKLNLEISESYAKKMFLEVDQNSKTATAGDRMLDQDEFFDFFSALTSREDLCHVLRLFSFNSTASMSAADLENFLTNEQKFDGVDLRKAESLIDEFETGAQESVKNRLLGPIGIRRLLQSKWGSPTRPGHEVVFQDMNHPLCHYFINSSHNTYLMGLQLTGEATVEGYINALKKGARLLELDIFDGDNGEPCITHKRTLISSITLRDALQAIDQYAFVHSPYPVILTIENHVGLVQQKVMARIFREVLGDKLYVRPSNVSTRKLPSPEALRGKYLLRGKRQSNGRDEQLDQDLDEEPLESPPMSTAAPPTECIAEISLTSEFSDLISLPSVKLTQNIYEDIEKHPVDGSPSLSENKVASFFEGGYSMALYTATRLVKSYPKGLRQDSSNMDPLPSWICGVSSVAMNMQTSDVYMDLVKGLFRINGQCGYYLKPACLLEGIDPRMSYVSSEPKMTLSVGIISGQYLPKPTPGNDIIDPYVTCEIFGIPVDRQKARSKTVANNGFNPQWNETVEFKLYCPEFALLRLCVNDFDSTSADDFVGEFTIPVSSLRPGYSHVRLNTGYNHTVDPSATLFIRVAIEKQPA